MKRIVNQKKIKQTDAGRVCAECKTVLSIYNHDNICAQCMRKQVDKK